MKRAPFQILVFPFHIKDDNKIRYALFKRREGYWQGIAGGGKGRETPFKAARREAFEEAGIPLESRYLKLDSMAMIPVPGVCGFLKWGRDVLVIPEHSFGVEVDDPEMILSAEHTSYRWEGYEQAHRRLHWDSNKTALWELNQRLTQRAFKRRLSRS